MSYDVIVIGGGPVGSRVAYKLNGMGYSVAVLERKRNLGGVVCCTGIIGRECVDKFTVDDGVILRWVNSAQLFSPSGNFLRLWRQEPQAAIVDRAAFNVAIAKRAQDGGVEYLFDSIVGNIEIGDDEVSIDVVSQGDGVVLKARVVVLANGFASRMTEDLGLGSFGDSTIGAQAEVEAEGIEEIEVYCGQEIAPSFFAWLVPTSSGRALVGLLSRRSPGIYLRKFMSHLLTIRKITSVNAELNYGGVPLLPLSRTYSKRLMVVGTAAGQVKPTTGGGIYYGLLCADIAAINLHQALRIDNLSARNLAGYEREWKKKLGRELKTGYWIRKLYERLSNRQIDRIFHTIDTSGILNALLEADYLSFDWHRGAIIKLITDRYFKGLLRR